MKRTITILATAVITLVPACGERGSGATLSGDVAGTVRLLSGDQNGNWQGACAPSCSGGLQENEECVGSPDVGFADIKAGTAVVIKDPASGDVLASTTLERGSLVKTGKQFDLLGLGVMVDEHDCVFPFHVSLPTTSKYALDVAGARVASTTEDGEIHIVLGE